MIKTNGKDMKNLLLAEYIFQLKKISICLISKNTLPNITVFHNGFLRCSIEKGYQVYPFVFGFNDDKSKIIPQLGKIIDLLQVIRALFADMNQDFKQKANI